MRVLSFSAQFEVEKGCTHKCSHCYNGYFNKVRKNQSTTNQISKKVSKLGFFNIVLTGGEPLLNKNQLYKTMDFFNKENVDFSLNSNLHLLTYKDAKIIKEKGTKSILTSILGDEKTHNKITSNQEAFRNLMGSLEIICNEGIPVSVNMVVLNENIDQIYPIGEMLVKRFKINSFCATPKVPSPDHCDKSILSREEYIKTLDVLLRLNYNFGVNVESLHPAIPCMFEDEERMKYDKFFNSRGCVAAKGTLTISAEGNVRVCSHENKVYGNILEEEINNIFKKMRKWEEGLFIPDECKPCDYYLKCRGGCRITSKILKGSWKSTHPFYKNPIITDKLKNKTKPMYKSLKVNKGNIRFREENYGAYSIYINEKANITTDELGFLIFRRYMYGVNYDDLLKEVENQDLLDSRIDFLFQRKLLIE